MIKTFGKRIANAIQKTVHRIGLRWMLLILGGLLIAAAVVVAVVIYTEGDRAQESADALLEEYDAAVSAQTQHPQESAQPVDTDTLADATDAQPTPLPTPVFVDTLDGYKLIGRLDIEKIDAELPVIAKMTKAALKLSVCYYEGPAIGQPGNLVITGHNYANGAHFGRLDELDVGDIVTITSPKWEVFTYEVYETLVVRPDRADELEEYEGDYGLTLLTCTSHGNRRLIVRCRLVDIKR